MSYDSWTCISVSKGPGMLSNGMQSSIKMAACILFKFNRGKMNFRGEECEGILTTDWKDFRLGSRSGVLFHADLEGTKGRYQVNFLISREDLERGAAMLDADDWEDEDEDGWIESRHTLPLSELYKFLDLRREAVQ